MAGGEVTKFGRYLLDRMADAGFSQQRDLAAAANVSNSTVSRLLHRADYRPDVDVLRRLARALNVPADALIEAVYAPGSSLPDRFELAVHPLAAELARALADDSPLTDEERATLERVVDWVLEPARKAMRRR